MDQYSAEKKFSTTTTTTTTTTTRLPVFYSRGPHVSIVRQCLNFLGCLVIIPIYYLITGHSRYPLTLDLLISIFVAEYNRYSNENRRHRAYHAPPHHALPQNSQNSAAVDLEKAAAVSMLSPKSPNMAPECMAAVVGYREDPELFARALESYRTAEGCRFVLAGVDGDQAPDMEMVQVFRKVRR